MGHQRVRLVYRPSVSDLLPLGGQKYEHAGDFLWAV